MTILSNNEGNGISIQSVNYKKHHSAISGPLMKQICKGLEESYNITHFSYEKLYNNRRVTFLTTHPDFTEIFIQNKFYEFAFTGDPQEYITGYYLYDTLPKNELMEACHDFNFARGIILVKQHESYCEFFYFAAPNHINTMNNFFINNLHLLEQFTFFFKEKAKTLIQEAERCQLLCPSNLKENLLSNTNIQKSVIKQPCYFKITTNAYDPYLITPQEKNCLLYLKQGYTAKEIGKKIGISHRTIEKHVDHLKSKLHCRS